LLYQLSYLPVQNILIKYADNYKILLLINFGLLYNQPEDNARKLEENRIIFNAVLVCLLLKDDLFCGVYKCLAGSNSPAKPAGYG
jgi:hypothetical protein